MKKLFIILAMLGVFAASAPAIQSGPACHRAPECNPRFTP